MIPTEHVLVVPTALFQSIGHFQGFNANADKYREILLRPDNVAFLPRSVAETDPGFKQLIPYMIFQYIDPSGKTFVFRYVRGKGQGEGRLHHKSSVGIGGHISSIDRSDSTDHDLYREGMNRELNEEVIIETNYTEHCVGLINDDKSEVGRVHLGIVHCFDLEEPKMRANEPDIIESGFVEVGELLADLSGFESWSAICLQSLFGQPGM